MKKIISLLLILSMIMGICSSVYGADFKNECENTDGAYVVRAFAPSTITPVEKDGRSCLEIKTDSTQGVTGANDPNIDYEYKDITGRYQIFTVDMMVSDKLCDRNVIMWLTPTGNAPVIIRPVTFSANGKIGYKNEGAGFVNFPTPFEYKEGEWYSIKVELDTENSSGNIYINGEKMNTEQIKFNSRKGKGGITKIRLVNQDTSNIVAHTYVDFFGVSETGEIENYIAPKVEKELPLLDVESHSNADIIFELNTLGIIDGYKDKSFCPEEMTAFDAFVKMVVRAMGKDIENGSSYWAELYLREALASGLITEAMAENPTRLITNREIAYILAKALSEASTENEEAYTKYIKNYEEISEEYKAAVSSVFSKGIMLLDSEDNFDGLKNVSRAKAAEILVRFLKPEKRPSVKYTVGIYAADEFKGAAEKILGMLSDEYIGELLNTEDMENDKKVNANTLDCIILLNALSETDGAKKTLKAFLTGGGDIITAGGELLTKFNNSDWQLPIYEGFDYTPYDLGGTKTVVTAKNQKVIEDEIKISAAEEFDGSSAVGFLFPNQSVFIPVLTALGEAGEEKGHAAGILTQIDGKYDGGKWLMFGIENPEFYKEDGFFSVVGKSLERFRCGCIDGVYTKEKVKSDNMVALEAFEITEPKPTGSVTVDRKTGRLIKPDGKELFVIGANTFGDAEYYLGMGNDADGSFSVEKIENIFRIASENGVNVLRFWSLPTEGKRVDVVKNMARKYGIYIYIHLGIVSDREKDVENIEKYAKAYGDEPMVIGYDLANEPQFNQIMTRFDGEENPLVKAKVFENCKDYMTKWQASFDWLYDDANLAYNGWYDYMSPELKKQLIAADVMYRKELFEGTASLSLTGIKLKENYDAQQKIAFDALNDTIEKWIESRKEIIHKYDSDALVTVGYFNQLGLFPANEKLDFQNFHAYTYANSKEDIADAFKAFDKINGDFPSSPTMFGEFCYSGGQILKSGEHKGELADFDVANAGEVAHWLYAYSKGYAGSVIWALQEWNPANYRFGNGQYGAWEPADGLRRERQGLLYYAGDKDNKYKAKPVAKALKFFSEHMAEYNLGDGEFLTTDADNQAGFGFSYKTQTSEYAANTSYKSDVLSFESERTPMVMADWSKGRIDLMATCDTTVRIKPAKCISSLNAEGAVVEGVYKNTAAEGEEIVLDLVAGCMVTIK